MVDTECNDDIYVGSRVNQDRDCDDQPVLLDCRLITAIIVWTVLLSVVVLGIVVVIFVDRSPSQLDRVPSSTVLLQTTSSTNTDVSDEVDMTLSQQADMAAVQRHWSNTLWLDSLRDENWIVYPATATVVSHRSANQRSLHDVGLHGHLTLH